MKVTVCLIAQYILAIALSWAAIAQVDFWEQAGSDPLDTRAVAVGPNFDIYVATFTDGIYRSVDNGNTWTQVNNGLTNLLGRALAVDLSGHVYAGTDFGGVFKSTDSGASWAEKNNGLGNLGINALAVNAAGDVFAGTQGGLFRSTDGAESWSLVFEGSGSSIRVIVIDSASGAVFAAGWPSGVFARSDDNGESWTNLSGVGAPTSSVQALGLSGGSVFAGLTFGGIYRSIDNGAAWTEINSGLPQFPEIRAIVSDGEGVYASIQSWGVVRSTDGGDSWTDSRSGLPISPLLGLRAMAANSRGDLFIGTSVGVYRHVSTSTSVEGSDEQPLVVSLEQNYPNPFNPGTTIGFTLGEPGRVSLRIFDVLGREVATLLNQNLTAQRYEVEWEASGVPSGVYVYRLTEGRTVRERTLILMR